MEENDVNSARCSIDSGQCASRKPGQCRRCKKASLSTKKLTVKVGQSKKLKLKNNKKKVSWKIVSGKKNIALKSKKKTGVTVTGKKKGTAKVQAKVGKKKYTCKVTVQAKEKAKATPKPTAKPSPKPTDTPTKTPGPDGVLTLYYNDKNAEEVWKQIQDSNVPVHVIVEDSINIIRGFKFFDCSNLISIKIPASVTSIHQLAFEGCTGLTNISIAEGNSTYDSRNNCNAIIETNTNTLIIGCKNTTIPDSITSIGKKAFSNCSGLNSISIPDSVTSIGGSAFSGCHGLTNITIPDSITSIGTWAFSDCRGLTNITIPDSVTSIGEGVFYGCTGLTKIIWKGTTYENVNSFENAFGGFER